MAESSDSTKIDIEKIKNDAHDNEDFQTNFKIAAASDARHDLGVSFTRFFQKKKYTDIGTPMKDVGEMVPHGWDVVKLMIDDKYKKQDIPGIWETADKTNPYKEPFEFKDEVLTKFTNYKYTVSSLKIKKEVTTPEQLFDFLSNGADEILVIWDATTGPFTNILFEDQKKAPEKNRQVTIVINREAISDPSGKPNEDCAFYKEKANKNRVVKVQVANESESEKTSILYSQWKAQRNDYHSDFFSNFNITLAPVTYGKNKSTKIIFNDEKGHTKESKIETTKEGKLTNSKLGMVGILNTLFKSFFNSERNKFTDSSKEKDYHISLQQKRSGDTLMCLSYFDNNRKYKISGGGEWTFGKKRKEEIPIFVLTHDTFNTLPIGIANGVNIIYTGAAIENKYEQFVYKFERDKESVDYTLNFFNEYIKPGENQTKMKNLFKQHQDIYNKNISNLLLVFNKFYTIALEDLKNIDKNIEYYEEKEESGEVKRGTARKYINQQILGTEGKDDGSLNRILKNLTETLYKYALYKQKVETPIDFETINGKINELANEVVTDRYTLTKQKVEEIRMMYLAEEQKEYELIYPDEENIIEKLTAEYLSEEPPKLSKLLTEDKTKFGKEFQENNNVKEGIRKFNYFKDKSNWNFIYQQRTKYVFGIAPELVSIFTSRDKSSYFNQFIEVLETIEKKKYIKDDLKKNFSNFWKYMVDQGATMKYEDEDRRELIDSIEEAIYREVQPPDRENETENDPGTSKIPEDEQNGVNTNSAIIPYHAILVNECSDDMTSKISGMNIVLDLVSRKSSKVSNVGEKGEAPEAMVGGNLFESFSNKDDATFYRLLCLNYFILSNRYTQEQKKRMDEMDIFGSNIPILGTILAEYLQKKVPVESFLLFFLLGIYLAGAGEGPISAIHKTICPDSPFFYHFPELLQEFVSLTLKPSDYEKVIRIAEYYPEFVQIFQLRIPMLPDISQATFEKADVAIERLYHSIGKERSELIKKQSMKVEQLVKHSGKIAAPLRLISEKREISIPITAGGKRKKTRRASRKTNRRTRKQRGSK